MARANKQPRTLADIDAEIRRLQSERDAVRASEIKGVIVRIKEAIDAYRLTAIDLGLAGAGRDRKQGGASRSAPSTSAKTDRRDRRSATAKRNGTAGAPKYHDGQGHTWSGRGRRPAWFMEAIAAGKTKDDLLL